MKLVKRRREKSCGCFRRSDSAKKQKLGDDRGELGRLWKRIKRGDRFGKRLHSGRINLSQLPAHGLGLFVRAGSVDGNAAEILRDFHEPLIVVVPFGGDFVNHHHALKSESELHKTSFA
jgi:hypothetical protein